MNIAFAGFRHDHIFVLYNMAIAHKDFCVVGAFEKNNEARLNAEAKGVTFVYDNYSDLLVDESVDVVAIGSCYGDRGKMAIEALMAGKHVICDKPLCTDLNELDKIEHLSKEKNLCVSCMFTMRFENKINAVKKIIENGNLGKINNVYIGGQHPLQYGRRPMWYFEKEKHGGVINDIAIHGIDLLTYLFGEEVVRINAARTWNCYAETQVDFKDSAQFMLTTKNNVGVICDVSYAIPNGVEFDLPFYWQFYIWGTKGVISFSFNEKETKYYLSGSKESLTIKEENFATDYLSDFIKLVNGEKDVVLSSQDVFDSTRKTLEIQQVANLLKD